MIYSYVLQVMGNVSVINNISVVLIEFLESLWFVIHPKNSIFVLTKCIEYLGFVLNSEDIKISLFDVKKVNIKLVCSEILKDELQL